MALPVPTEHEEAVPLAAYLHFLQNLGKITLYSHIPHETYTNSWKAKRKNASEGVRKGVPDYIIVINDTVLFIELKRKRGGFVSDEQVLWIEGLSHKKTIAYIAKGFEEAKRHIDNLLES